MAGTSCADADPVARRTAIAAAVLAVFAIAAGMLRAELLVNFLAVVFIELCCFLPLNIGRLEGSIVSLNAPILMRALDVEAVDRDQGKVEFMEGIEHAEELRLVPDRPLERCGG